MAFEPPILELVSALIASCESNIGADRLVDAEVMLQAARELDDSAAGLSELGGTINTAFIRREENRVRTIREMVRTKNISPRYPRWAEERGTSGWVELAFTVMPTGETTDVQVIGAEPESVFDKSAISAAEQWLFEPLEFRGQLISQRATTRLVFRLE